MSDRLPFAAPLTVLVRDVASNMDRCERENHSQEIDAARARTQHDAYVKTLNDLGLDVHRIPADDTCPDCCFIEDTAVITGKNAVVTRPGAASRRHEIAAVRSGLNQWCTLHTMEAPLTLDGGDVLRAGNRLFVGTSSRTNPQGAEFLRKIAALDGLDVVVVNVRGGLHLKSSCTLAGPDHLVHFAGSLDITPFRDAGLRCTPVIEPFGANVLVLGPVVLVSSRSPATADLLSREKNIAVRLIDVSEFHKADGALTCLSIRIPRPGAWCT